MNASAPDRKILWFSVLAYLFVSACLAAIPLTRTLQAESAAIVAFFSFFIAGIATIASNRPFSRVASDIKLNLACLALPLLVLGAGSLFRGCSVSEGLLLFLLFPVVTAIFASFLAATLTSFGIKKRAGVLIVTGVLVSAAGVIYDFSHPQFYTYSHVFGGVLGPVYDSQLSLRPGLFTFRLLTLGWCAAFALFALRKEAEGGVSLTGIFFTCAIAVLTFGFGDYLGFNSSDRIIRKHLDDERTDERLAIYFDGANMHGDRIDYVWREAQFEYDRLSSILRVEMEEPVRVYLYPDEKTKGDLTGSRRTSVTPTWLRSPQIHMLESEFDHSFSHELVHVLAREFGGGFTGASRSVGLVEGLAVALQQPNGRPSLPDLWDHTHSDSSLSTLHGESLADSFGPLSFWSARGGVAYGRSGSFVRFLITSYGIEKLKRVYASSNFPSAYEKTLDDLEGEWRRGIQSRGVDSSLATVGRSRFSVLSLAETQCPHDRPRWLAVVDEAMMAAEEADTSRTIELLTEAFRLDPKNVSLLRALRDWQLSASVEAEPVDEALLPNPLLLESLADVAALGGDRRSALEKYELAAIATSNTDTRALIILELKARLAGDSRMVRRYYSARSLALPLANESDAIPARSLHQLTALRLSDRGSYTEAASLFGRFPIDADTLVLGTSRSPSIRYAFDLLATDSRIAAKQRVSDGSAAVIGACPAGVFPSQCAYGDLLLEKDQYFSERDF